MHSLSRFHPKIFVRFSALSFVLAAWFFASFAQAQNPGYMGKKTVVSYGFNIGPSFAGANWNNRFWNKIHELSIEFTTSSKWQIGLIGRAYSTIYDNKVEVYQTNQKPANYYSIQGLTAGVLFKSYGKSYVAPWGPYFMFGPVLNVVNTKYDNYMYTISRVQNHDTLLSDFGPNEQRFLRGDLMFGWGQSRIIKDRVVIDYGFNCQLLALFSSVVDYDLGSYSGLEADTYIEKTAMVRMRGMNRFNLFIKLGYLF